MQSFFIWTAKTDQTARMRRLICVFARRTCMMVRFLALRRIQLYYFRVVSMVVVVVVVAVGSVI